MAMAVILKKYLCKYYIILSNYVAALWVCCTLQILTQICTIKTIARTFIDSDKEQIIGN